MDSLIAELEKAGEGSRKLDALIFCAVFYPDKKPERNFFYTNREEWGVFVTNQPRPGTTFHDAPHYTTNLQDALGLVGDAAWWEVRKMRSADSVIQHFDSDNGMFSARVANSWGEPGYLAQHDNPALALTIAALKARREA